MEGTEAADVAEVGIFGALRRLHKKHAQLAGGPYFKRRVTGEKVITQPPVLARE